MSEKYRVAVLTISDKGSIGERIDEGGPLIKEMLEEWGQGAVVESAIIPDDFETIKKTLIHLCDEIRVDLVLTTGGTGLSPRDVTPEATIAVSNRNVPGIAFSDSHDIEDNDWAFTMMLMPELTEDAFEKCMRSGAWFSVCMQDQLHRCDLQKQDKAVPLSCVPYR